MPTILDVHTSPSAIRLLVAALAALLGGVVNSVAGGGTLLTFPALIAAGLSPLVANGTSTVALLPGALASMIGYRGELAGARRWATFLTPPSLAGGALGAFLLLRAPASVFDAVVPWLVLGATALFVVQRPLLRRLRRTDEAAGAAATATPRPAGDPDPRRATFVVPLTQLAVGTYGGYFGAGVGILMLASLGFLGFTNIHRMNGLKNWGGLCINATAAVTFALLGLVDWPVAIAMAAGAMLGGYAGSRLAQRVKPESVRLAVIVIGFTAGLWLLR